MISLVFPTHWSVENATAAKATDSHPKQYPNCPNLGVCLNRTSLGFEVAITVLANRNQKTFC